MEDKSVEKIAMDYAKYADSDFGNKLKPLNQTIDKMLSCLDDYQTMIAVMHQEGGSSKESLEALTEFSKNVNSLCSRVESIEKLVSHIKANLNYLEASMDKAEHDIGYTENTSKVTNIFMPLFKKSTDKTLSPQNSTMFKTEDYFDTSAS